MSQVAFIGGGNMATSIIGGLVNSNADDATLYSSNQIIVSDPNEHARQQLEDQFSVLTCDDNATAIANAEIVVIAVKPQVLAEVLQPLKDKLSERQPLLISIAAGIDMAALSRWSGCQAIVRGMPNTPALYGKGATGLFASEQVSLDQRNHTDALLKATGITLWVSSEQQIDAVTAVSGSGPAYYFLMMESMIEAGIQLGLDAETAHQLTLQTALGAGVMATNSEFDPAELRRRVTSPGGTTEQALNSFEDAGFRNTVLEAMSAANQRAQELSRLLGGNDSENQ